LLEYAKTHFRYYGGDISGKHLDAAPVVLGGYSSIVVESFVLGTPTVLIQRHDSPTAHWPLYEEMEQILPVVPMGHESKIAEAIERPLVKDAARAAYLRERILYPRDGKAAERAASAIEVQFGGNRA